MAAETLADVVNASDDLVATFRNTDLSRGEVHWETIPAERTNWIEEQRAWRETCMFMDQSYHLSNYYIEGPDALRVNSDLGLNSFADFADPPHARHHPVCNPDGYIIGEPILFQLAPERVAVVGNRGLAQRWIHYNLETGDYDAEVTRIYSPYGNEPPADFRFEIQGPHARDLVGEVLDDDVPDISFFQIETATIDGREVYVFGHGMAAAKGYEIFGPYEYHDEVKAQFTEVGEEYGLRELGSESYKSATLTSGWLPPGLPAVYDHGDMQGYREWLPASSIEANWSLGGSFVSEDITDYYLDAVELGYENLITADHDAVGKEALRAKLDNPTRKKVTFVWEPDDILAILGSLFRQGPSKKSFSLPVIAQQWDMGHFDEVRVNGERAGVSMFTGYDFNERAMLSLGVVDREYAEPGTEVSVVWGETDTQKRNVERHELAEVRATVHPAPYVRAREDL